MGIGIVQRSFFGGEITPALYQARSDQTKVANGASTMDNWLVNKNGSASNRPGTRFVVEVKDSSKATRVVPFEFNDADAVVLEVGEYYIRFVQDASQVLTGSQSDWADATAYTVGDIVVDGAAGAGSGNYFYCVADHTSADGTNGPHDAGTAGIWWYALTSSGASAILEIPTPYAEADLFDIQFEQLGDIVWITGKGYPPMELSRLAADTWTLLPSRFAPATEAPTGISLSGGDAAGPADNSPVYKITAVGGDGGPESLPGQVSTTDTGTIAAQGVSSDLSVNAAGHLRSTGDEIYISDVTVTAPTTDTNQHAVIYLDNRTFRITVTDADNFTLDGTAGLLTLPQEYPNAWPDVTITFGLAYIDGASLKVPDDSTASSFIDLSWTAVTGAEEYWIYRAEYGAANDPWDADEYTFIGASKGTNFTDKGATPDGAEPPPDHPPPFVSGTWPATAAFYQQRLCFGGSTDNPRIVKMSRTGDIRNFTTRRPAQDDDAITFEITGTDEVRHLVHQRQLVVLMRSSIWIVRGNGDGTITPNAINLELQTAQGAAMVAPVVVGETVLYAQAKNTILRDLGYTFQSDSYQGRDLTVFADHLFSGQTITDMAFAESPEPILWVVRDDGAFLSLTYLSEHDIWGWASHSGKAIARARSVAVITESNASALYLVVQRLINGSIVRYIERLQPRQIGHDDYDPRVDPWFVDSGLAYDGRNTGSDTMTLSGGPPWTAGSTLTLTDSGANIAGTEEGWRIKLLGAEVEVTYVSGSGASATVTADQDVPAALQGVATTTWTTMEDGVSGLDHLEGETVRILADGSVQTSKTVSSGEITLDTKAGYVIAGLGIDADLATVDIDTVGGGDAIADKKKSLTGASLLIHNTRGLKVGENGSNLFALVTDAEYDASYSAPTPPPLITDKVRAPFDYVPNRHGRFLIRQTDPLPATVQGFVVWVEVHGR